MSESFSLINAFQLHINSSLKLFTLESTDSISILPTSLPNTSWMQIVIIQKLWRKQRNIKLSKLIKKKLKNRTYILKEILSSEESYFKSINSVLHHLFKPSINNGILTKELADLIFSYLEPITLLSGEIIEQMNERYKKGINPVDFCIADILIKNLVFFKIYFPYCNNYKDSMNRILEMKKDVNNSFVKLLAKLEYSKEFENMDLISLLIKPVQRLPKYVLLLKDLKKNTEKTHLDYNNIEVCYNKFLVLNEDNNKKMNDYLNELRLFELDKLYSTKKLQILTKNRLFLFEDSFFMLTEDLPKSVTTYFFNDLILVIENSELILALELDVKSFISDLKASKYFKSVFSIHGKTGCIILNAESQVHKKKTMEFIETKILAKLKEIVLVSPITKVNNFNFINVKTIGTFRRGIQNFKPFTVYILNLINNEKQMKIFLRYNELVKLDIIVTKEFPDLKIPHFPTKLTEYFSSQKSKTIEKRRLMIENFIQTLIFNQEEINKQKDIHNLLQIPKEFLTNKPIFSKFIELLEEKSLKFNNASVFSQLVNVLYKGKTFFHVVGTDSEAKEILSVKTLNNKKIDILFGRERKVLEICAEIAEKLGLESWVDFKLFIVNNQNQETILDDEEFLNKALEKSMDEETGTEIGFFGSIKKKINYIFKGKFIPDDFNLVFKKLYFLDLKHELIDLSTDYIKLDLVFYQILVEINDFKYILSPEEYVLIAAIKGFALFADDESLFRSNLDKILDILPKKLKNKKETHTILFNFFNQLCIEINKSVNDTNDISKKKNLVKLGLINIVKDKNTFGSNLFWVSWIKKEKSNMANSPDFIWISVKFDCLELLTPNIEKKNIIFLEYENFEEIQSYPESIKIVIKGVKYRFNTKKGLEIIEIIRVYRKLKGLKEI